MPPKALAKVGPDGKKITALCGKRVKKTNEKHHAKVCRHPGCAEPQRKKREDNKTAKAMARSIEAERQAALRPMRPPGAPSPVEQARAYDNRFRDMRWGVPSEDVP
jgi:hypothetical protein